MKDRDSIDRGAEKKGLAGILDSIEGDKVIWIVALLLIVISVLLIFSSTPMLSEKSRIEIMKDHGMIALAGLGLIIFLYKVITKIGIYRFFSQFGFIVSLILLIILDGHGKCDIGPFKAQYINGAWRTLDVFGLQLHVFEVVKVAMVMYLAWGLHAMKTDREAMENNEESPTLRIANNLSKHKHFGFMKTLFAKRVFYLYIPILLVSGLVLIGSNSSGIFIGAILIGILLLGEVPLKEMLAAGGALLLVIGGCFIIYKLSDGKYMDRMETFEKRLTRTMDISVLDKFEDRNSEEFYQALGPFRQPYGARIAVHEGKLIGKHFGNSTQKYSVTHIYSDYMFSFIIEEMGLIGGIFIMFLYLSLIARCSTIISLCRNEFAKVAIGGLAFLITGQAFLHILVNSGVIPLTGQTLPLLSDGATAFLSSCLAFGIILSISRMVNKKMKQVEEAQYSDTYQIQARISQLEKIDDETHLQ